MEPLGFSNSECMFDARPQLKGSFSETSSLKSLVETSDPQTAADAVVDKGVAVLQNAFIPEEVDDVLGACEHIAKLVSQRDRRGEGNRGPGRYSFSSVTVPKCLFHMEQWTMHLLDNAKVLAVLDHVFGPPGEYGRPSYVAYRADGDYCLGTTRGFQPMHSDWNHATVGALGPKTRAYNPLYSCHTPPLLCVNFCVQPLTRWNGSMRVVPWASMAGYGSTCPPSLHNEPADCLSSKLFPQRAGNAIIRDVRVWHGGTPNLTGESRYLPSVMFMSRTAFEWVHTVEDRSFALIPNALFHLMSKRAQALRREIHAADPADEANHHVNDPWLRQDVTEHGRRKQRARAKNGGRTQWRLASPGSGYEVARAD